MPQVSDAEEVVQQTLQALIESARRVELETTPLQYAIGILKNKVRDHYRRLGRRPTEPLEDNIKVSESLSVMRFEQAEGNKRYADFCMEMQEMGIMERTRSNMKSVP